MDFTEEVWKEHPDYEGYLFSNYGYCITHKGKELPYTATTFYYRGKTISINHVLNQLFSEEDNVEAKSRHITSYSMARMTEEYDRKADEEDESYEYNEDDFE